MHVKGHQGSFLFLRDKARWRKLQKLRLQRYVQLRLTLSFDAYGKFTRLFSHLLRHAFIYSKSILEHLLGVSLCDGLGGDNTGQILSVQIVYNLMEETNY